MIIQTIAAVISYIICTCLLGIKIFGSSSVSKKTRIVSLIIGFTGIILHGHLLYQSIVLDSGFDFGFFNAVSLISWLVTSIVLITSLFRPLENLLLILFPIAGSAILLELFVLDGRLLSESLSIGLRIHILLSICAYSLLMISAIQALMLALQEKLIKEKRAFIVMSKLPPLQIMEALLIQIIIIGFFMLSLSLVSGTMFIDDIFRQHLAHKTILSIMAWFIYATLLWGRWSAGWRGKKIIRWALGGVTALLLAYLGSKFVLEVILQRL